MGPVGDLQEYVIVLIDLFSKWSVVDVVEKADITTVLEFRKVFLPPF